MRLGLVALAMATLPLVVAEAKAQGNSRPRYSVARYSLYPGFYVGGYRGNFAPNEGPTNFTWYNVSSGYSSALQTGLPWQGTPQYRGQRTYMPPTGPAGSVAQSGRVPTRDYYVRGVESPQARPRQTNPLDRQELLPAVDKKRVKSTKSAPAKKLPAKST